MDKSQIGTWITHQIEDYVEALEASNIETMQAEYAAASRSMFDWLREYRCGPREIGRACNVIQKLTGYHPSQVRSLDDATVVKTALYGALNSEALGRRVQPNDLINPAQWAIDSVDFGHGGSNDPLDR